ELAVYHRPDPAIAVGRPAIHHSVDLLQDCTVNGPLIVASPPHGRRVVGGLPREAERPADRGHRLAGHFADPLRNHGLFFTTSCAACRISTSICFRPRSRSSSRIRCWASRSALAGTTSSFAATAVVAPVSTRRFHSRMTLGWMSSSRLTSARVFSPFTSCWTIPRLNSTVKIRRPSDFRANSPMGPLPPAAAGSPHLCPVQLGSRPGGGARRAEREGDSCP